VKLQKLIYFENIMFDYHYHIENETIISLLQNFTLIDEKLPDIIFENKKIFGWILDRYLQNLDQYLQKLDEFITLEIQLKKLENLFYLVTEKLL
jgi:hypothetical protein